MTALAIHHNPYFELNDVELRSSDVSFTVKTIEAVKKMLPPDASLHLIMGTDSLSELATWKDPDRIVDECVIVAVTRPGYEVPDNMVSGGKGVFLIQCRGVDISSTEIRRRVRNGESARYLLPDDVLSYIASHGLYREK